jgi:hypothetical protein
MNRWKIILFLALVFAFVSTLIFYFSFFHKAMSSLNADANQGISSLLKERFKGWPVSENAFVSVAPVSINYPSLDTSSSGVGIVSTLPTSTPIDVNGFGTDAENSNKASLTQPTQQIVTLPLPNISDSELIIDARGVSSTMAYVVFFNDNYKNIVFDSVRFDAVLKDKNGVPLFVPALVEKALTDGNFSEVKNSLLVQKDFANAEITFMKSIKVTDKETYFNKQAIGMEKLTVNLADKALAVASGSMPQKELSDFYAAFLATAARVNGRYINEVQTTSFLLQKETLLGKILSPFLTYFSPVAHAQTPFGGPVLAIIPDPVLQGAHITVGPPIMAEVFVPWAFLASPLFFSTKTLAVGSWWLGLYEPISEEIIMVGTSFP